MSARSSGDERTDRVLLSRRRRFTFFTRDGSADRSTGRPACSRGQAQRPPPRVTRCSSFFCFFFGSVSQFEIVIYFVLHSRVLLDPFSVCLGFSLPGFYLCFLESVNLCRGCRTDVRLTNLQRRSQFFFFFSRCRFCLITIPSSGERRMSIAARALRGFDNKIGERLPVPRLHSLAFFLLK